MAKDKREKNESSKIANTLQIFFPYQIKVAKAHLKGLNKIRLINKSDLSKLTSALTTIEKDFKKGKMRTKSTDAYSIIEKYLTKKVGATAKKFTLHGSKIDQAQTASRLFMKDALLKIRKHARKLSLLSLSIAEKNQDTKTGHYLCALTESLITDIEFIDNIKAQIDYCPLGAVKGEGTSIILERDFIAKELEFKKTQINSYYCVQGNTKYESMFLAGLKQIMLTLKTHDNKPLNEKPTKKALIENTESTLEKLISAEKLIKKIHNANYIESEKSLISLGAPGNLDIHYYKTTLKKL